RFATSAEFADALTRPMEAGRPRRARLTTAAAVAAVLVAAGWWGIHAVSSRAASINRLAVLPLENLTGDTTQHCSVEGMHDARPVDPQANDLYLKGRYYCAQFAEAGFTRGIGFYRRAIDQDPTFALAYAGLAECYGVLPLFTFAAPQDAFRKAKAAVTRALEL